MNLATVDKIAKAVLYEGYMLYPYRPSSVKNQQRWNFGVLCPQSYSEAQKGSEAWTMQTECLVEGSSLTGLEVRVRFLQLVARSVGELDPPVSEVAAGGSAGVSSGGKTCGEWPRLPALAGSDRAGSCVCQCATWKRSATKHIIARPSHFPAEKQFEYLLRGRGTDCRRDRARTKGSLRCIEVRAKPAARWGIQGQRAAFATQRLSKHRAFQPR